MNKIKILVLSLLIMLVPALSLGATGHINGCTNTSFDANCCTKTFRITPQAGYTVTDVIVNGVSQGPLTSYTFSNITGPQTLKVITEATSGSSEETTEEIQGSNSGSTNTDCIVLNPRASGITLKMNGSTIPAGQHIIPYGTTLEFIANIGAHMRYVVYINGIEVFYREGQNGSADISYNYTVVGDMSYFFDNDGGNWLHIYTNRCNGLIPNE